jgi:Serine carboxypeptidase S28
MTSLKYLLLAVASISTTAGAGMSHHRRFLDILNGSPALEDDARQFEDVQELFIEQRLDHFQPNPPKFQQRYFYSDRHVKDSPTQQHAFLCVGGEGPSLTPAVLVDSVHCSGDMLELANQLNQEEGASVHLFALEHRYYGQSYPGM